MFVFIEVEHIHTFYSCTNSEREFHFRTIVHRTVYVQVCVSVFCITSYVTLSVRFYYS